MSTPPLRPKRPPECQTPDPSMGQVWPEPRVRVTQTFSDLHSSSTPNSDSREPCSRLNGRGLRNTDDSGSKAQLNARRRLRRWSHVFIVIALLLATATILAATLGTRAGSKTGSREPSAASSSASAASVSSSVPDVAKSHLSVLPESRLAVIPTTSTASCIVLFQDSSGSLAAVEWKADGELSSPYKLNDGSGITKLPKAQTGSPIRVVNSGSGEAHLFYADEKNHLVHLIRKAGTSEAAKWQASRIGGHGDGPITIFKKMRFAATHLPATDSVVVVYQLGVDVWGSLSSSNPGEPDSWVSTKFILSSLTGEASLGERCAGLALLLVNQTVLESHHEQVVRLLWDQTNETQSTTFGLVDCKLDQDGSLQHCAKSSDGREDASIQRHLKHVPGPMQLSATALAQETHEESGQYLLHILNGKGQYSELHWNGTQWAGRRDLDIEKAGYHNTSASFSSVTGTDTGLLIALLGYKLLRFQRTGAWWTRPDDGKAAFQYLDEMDLGPRDG